MVDAERERSDRSEEKGLMGPSEFESESLAPQARRMAKLPHGPVSRARPTT